MNPAVKTLWLQALRSGKYRQTQSWLKRTKDGKAEHCCLGVLCEIATVVGVATEQPLPGERESAFKANNNVSYSLPPYGVLQWAGLTRSEAEDIAEINDNGSPFERIADHIESRF